MYVIVILENKAYYQCITIILLPNQGDENLPKITIMVNDNDLKLIKRIARHEHRSVQGTTRSLVNMSLQMVRTEERTGLFYGPAPEWARPPKIAPVLKPVSRYAGWTKIERDIYILTGIIPAAARNSGNFYPKVLAES